MSAALNQVGMRPSDTQGAIRIQDVVKIYDPDGAAVMAVDHCSLDIAAGEICMIVGPSGCGKTTLLNAIAGFHSITSGRIYLDGELLCGDAKPMADPGPDRIVVFQNGALFPWKTNLDNVAFGAIMQGKLSKKEAYEKARSMIYKLSNILRRAMRAQENLNPLREELQFIDDYMAIELVAGL